MIISIPFSENCELEVTGPGAVGFAAGVRDSWEALPKCLRELLLKTMPEFDTVEAPAGADGGLWLGEQVSDAIRSSWLGEIWLGGFDIIARAVGNGLLDSESLEKFSAASGRLAALYFALGEREREKPVPTTA